jgi:hypothetical protein
MGNGGNLSPLPQIKICCVEHIPELLKIEEKKEEPPKLLESTKTDEQPKQSEQSVKLLTNEVPKKEKEEEEEEGEYIYIDLSTLTKN